MLKVKLIHSGKEVALDEMRLRSIFPVGENTLLVIFKDGEKLLGESIKIL